MKYVILLSLILFAIAGSSQSKEKYFAGYGNNLNKVKNASIDFKNSLGFYVNAGFLKEVSDHVDVSLAAQYQNQHARISQSDININAVSAVFGMRGYVIKRNTSILGGFEIGRVGSSKQDSEDLKIKDRGLFAVSAGLSHKVNETEVIAKINHIISDTFFQNTVQLGVNYHF